MTEIWTSYFNSKTHPQAVDPNTIGVESDGRVASDSYDYIKPWYDSMKSLGLRGKIFCDGVTDQFVKDYQTENILFVRVPNDNQLSLNCTRFFNYRNEMKRRIWNGELKLDDVIFMTDCADVTVVRDPAYLFESGAEMAVGDETIGLKDFNCSFGGGNTYFNVHEHFKWEKIKEFREAEYPLLNAGCVGGKVEYVSRFLEAFCTVCSESEKDKPIPTMSIDMEIVNYVLRSRYDRSDKLVVGDPLTSEFKAEQLGREDVCFIHK